MKKNPQNKEVDKPLMERIISLDYGQKRVGVAVSDPTKTISSPLTTVERKEIIKFLENYCKDHHIEIIVLGLPLGMKGEHTDMTREVEKFKAELENRFREIEVVLIDERLTSVIAQKSILSSGMKKKDRRNKSNIDMISASVILQSYLNRS